MSKLTGEQIRRIELAVHGYTRQPLDVKAFARAIESAATEPLLQRIAELEFLLTEKHNARVMWQNKAAELERQLEEAQKDVKPCPTCESLARAVMLDQTGKA